MSKPGMTARGEPMPQTMDEWKYLAELYAQQIEEDRDTIVELNYKLGRIRTKLETCRKRLSHAGDQR